MDDGVEHGEHRGRMCTSCATISWTVEHRSSTQVEAFQKALEDVQEYLDDNMEIRGEKRQALKEVQVKIDDCDSEISLAQSWLKDLNGSAFAAEHSGDVTEFQQTLKDYRRLIRKRTHRMRSSPITPYQ
jgi:septation ring formation regulator EzrA